MEEPESETTSDAPYGYKADGTPRKKPGRPAGGSNSSSSGTRTKTDEALQERISAELTELSAPLAIVSPLAMLHVAERADRTSRALVVISKKHPAVKVAIEAYFDSVAYKDIALFVLGIHVAIMIDMQILKPDAVVGRVWKFGEKYDELYGNEGSEFYDQPRAEARGLSAQLG